MKVYKVTIKIGNGNVFDKIVVAETIEKAIENCKRYIKKNYYSSAKVVMIELIHEVDIFYKS